MSRTSSRPPYRWASTTRSIERRDSFQDALGSRRAPPALAALLESVPSRSHDPFVGVAPGARSHADGAVIEGGEPAELEGCRSGLRGRPTRAVGVRQLVYEDAGDVPAIAGLEGALGEGDLLAVDGVRGRVPPVGDARIEIDPDVGVAPHVIEGSRRAVRPQQLEVLIALALLLEDVVLNDPYRLVQERQRPPLRVGLEARFVVRAGIEHERTVR